MIARLDAFQRRHRVLGLPIALFYKYIDDQGAYLAALITYYGFVSMFPLLLLLSSILGFVLESDPEMQGRIMESAFRQIPVIGDQVQRAGLRGSTIAVVIGALGALYGALGVAQAMQNAMNQAWFVPRNSRPNPILARLRSAGLLLLVAIFLVVTTLLAQSEPTLAALGASDRAIGVWGRVASAAITWVLFMVISRYGTAYAVTLAQALPGSILGVLAWQSLQTLGTTFVQRFIAGATATNGVFAVVLGLLAWIYLAAVAFVLCTELNVVLALDLHPRALLTPLTDDVDLTDGDLAAYAGLARAQRLKGFQTVQVKFEHDGQFRTARVAREESERLAAEAKAETERRAEEARLGRLARRREEIAQRRAGARAEVAASPSRVLGEAAAAPVRGLARLGRAARSVARSAVRRPPRGRDRA